MREESGPRQAPWVSRPHFPSTLARGFVVGLCPRAGGRPDLCVKFIHSVIRFYEWVQLVCSLHCISPASACSLCVLWNPKSLFQHAAPLPIHLLKSGKYFSFFSEGSSADIPYGSLLGQGAPRWTCPCAFSASVCLSVMRVHLRPDSAACVVLPGQSRRAEGGEGLLLPSFVSLARTRRRLAGREAGGRTSLLMFLPCFRRARGPRLRLINNRALGLRPAGSPCVVCMPCCMGA